MPSFLSAPPRVTSAFALHRFHLQILFLSSAALFTMPPLPSSGDDRGGHSPPPDGLNEASASSRSLIAGYVRTPASRRALIPPVLLLPPCVAIAASVLRAARPLSLSAGSRRVSAAMICRLAALCAARRVVAAARDMQYAPLCSYYCSRAPSFARRIGKRMCAAGVARQRAKHVKLPFALMRKLQRAMRVGRERHLCRGLQRVLCAVILFFRRVQQRSVFMRRVATTRRDCPTGQGRVEGAAVRRLQASRQVVECSLQ